MIWKHYWWMIFSVHLSRLVYKIFRNSNIWTSKRYLYINKKIGIYGDFCCVFCSVKFCWKSSFQPFFPSLMLILNLAVFSLSEQNRIIPVIFQRLNMFLWLIRDSNVLTFVAVLLLFSSFVPFFSLYCFLEIQHIKFFSVTAYIFAYIIQ